MTLNYISSNDLNGSILEVNILQGRILNIYGDFVMIIDCKDKLNNKNKEVKQLKFTPVCVIHVIGVKTNFFKN